jgi:hypothetical protein
VQFRYQRFGEGVLLKTNILSSSSSLDVPLARRYEYETFAEKMKSLAHTRLWGQEEGSPELSDTIRVAGILPVTESWSVSIPKKEAQADSTAPCLAHSRFGGDGPQGKGRRVSLLPWASQGQRINPR